MQKFVFLTLFYLLIQTVFLQSVRAKMLSFLDKFPDLGNKEKENSLIKYNKFLDQITKENLLTLKFVKIYQQISLQPYFKIKRELKVSSTLKLFSVKNDFVISTELIKKSVFYDDFYKNIKSQGII